MKTACATVLVRSLSNLSRAVEASGASPIRSRAGQKSLTRLRKRASAPSAGSVAITSKPLARKQAAQLAPMTPVPTTATRADDVFAVFAIFCRPAFAGHLQKLGLALRQEIVAVFNVPLKRWGPSVLNCGRSPSTSTSRTWR
jgi:hypothetical protein